MNHTPPWRRGRLPRWPAILLGTALLGSATIGLTALAGGSDIVLDALLQRPKAESGVVVVPDRFLRSWDPLTVFFPSDVGPKGGGPGDDPAPRVRMEPEHPGAWTWLDARTLQFRPAIPWPPLDGVTVRAGGKVVFLSTLSSPPTETVPADGSEGLGEIGTVTLTFDQPVEPEMLARMTTIEVRPLPGIGAGPATRLGRDAFEVKVLDRSSASEPARYTLVLREPIGLGQRVVVRLVLSQDQAANEAQAEVRFSTAEPFRPVALGCDGQTLPVSPGGTAHPAERPLACTGQRTVRVSFTSALGAISPVDGRNLVRFEPSVDGLVFEPDGRDLVVRGEFLPEVPYRVSLAPAHFPDAGGRALDITGESAVWLYFGRREPFLRWDVGQGVAERFGPKRIPTSGRGLGTADLRIYRVDPLNRSLWPFPDRPLSVDESVRPPGPGEQPDAWDRTTAIPARELTARLAALPSPAWSGIVTLPIASQSVSSGPGAGARFGLDIGEQLARVSGNNAPGHYLVGLRRMDGGTTRDWVRLQVTDLALSTVEAPREVRFQVSSLRSGDGVGGASVRIEGERRDGSDVVWDTLYSGRTDGSGGLVWAVPGEQRVAVRRIVIEKGDDVLVLDPARAPDRFVDGTWLATGETWLQWAFGPLEGRDEAPQILAHLFPDRPIYRPGDEVHLKGYLRSRHHGHLEPVGGSGVVVVTGPGDDEWRLPVEVSREGSLYARWQEAEPPTGYYRAHYEDARGEAHGRTSFQVEAYRLPTFEVLLDGPAAAVPNDRAFEIGLSAAYYAGGPVAARPVRWRVTQYPLAWTPPGTDAYPGFVWSTDDRYARAGAFRASPELSTEDTTTAEGASALSLDPSLEADARPRTYTVEATVTGADDQTVTNTQRIDAVPAFVLGLQVPRYLPDAKVIPAEVLALGPDGKPVPGLDLTVRLIQRQWHSVLQATDFTAGEAKYLTDTVDVPKAEQSVRSGGSALKVPLKIDSAGVYWVEVEARDALDRVSVVRLDLYAGGEGAVGWEKPKAGTFELSADQGSYRPGQSANVVIRSPFQEGHALVVIEDPDRNVYREVAVKQGRAAVKIPIETGWVPRIPVHVVLWRGRTDDPVRGPLDVGRPQTVASTLWLAVEPVENRVEVAVKAPPRALPGAEVPLTVTLADPDGKPLSGEVTLWLVDQAVLALGQEQRLDPLPDFVTDRRSRTVMRDTRNQVLGSVPFDPMPGGDGEEGEMADVLENATIRKDFKAIAYYEPHLRVPASGSATVKVKLPDNLTVFKIRAKAVSGPERFGVGTGQIAVRLPVVLQPALPRFVRPGDRFDAAALVRVLEGDGGSAGAEISVTGLALGADAKRSFTLDPTVANRLAWPVVAETPPIGEGGALAWRDVTIKIGAKRSSDGATDAVASTLPLRDDRSPRYTREIVSLAPGASAKVDAIPEAARAGSVRRTVVLGSHEALLRMASALDVLRSSAPRGTDAIVARGRVAVGLGALRGPLGLEDDDEIRRIVEETIAWLPAVMDSHGLVAQYPGADGRVWLTADSLAFLADAASQGYPVDARIRDALKASLTASLRSDYRYFLDGESWTERAAALRGLSVDGRFDESYFAELSRNARLLVPEAQAMVLLAAHRGGQGSSAVARQIADRLGDEIVLELFEGKERYAGLKSRRTDRSPLIAPSEAREVATLMRALGAVRPESDRLGPLLDALVRLGAEDGWGQPNADAAAMLALAEATARLAASDVSLSVTGGSGGTLSIDPDHPVARRTSTDPGAITLKNTGRAPAAALVLSRWVPEAPGSAQQPEQRGFVVEREWLVAKEGGPFDRRPLQAGGSTLALSVGDIVEEHVRVVNPAERFHVVVTVPLAAGMEPLNPALATSGAEARPTNRTTAQPTWTSFGDDRVLYAFETLEKGTIDLYFRTRATTAGAFVQPAAAAEMLYDRHVVGLSAGASVEIAARP